MTRFLCLAFVMFTALCARGQSTTSEQLQLLPDTPALLGLSGASRWRFAPPAAVQHPWRARLDDDGNYLLELTERRANTGGLGHHDVTTELARAEIFDDGVSIYVTWYPSKSFLARNDTIPSIILESTDAGRRISIEPLRKRIREPESVVFVLDASGSMSGTKIVSAKKALAAAALALPEESEVALVVLFDCNVVSRVCDFTKSARSLIDKADPIQPSGGTPLGDAMQAAHSYLHAMAANPESRRRIVVLSDGMATCGADPGAIAAGWGTGSGASQRLAIIGLELSEMESASLRELAQKANGRYIDATESTVEAAMLRATGAPQEATEGDR